MEQSNPPFPRAGFFRRLAAMVYDVLVATAVAMVMGLLAVVIFTILLENGFLNKHGYEHVMDVMQNTFIYTLIVQIWVGTWVLIFFLWFWKNGGQTLGMRAWRLRLFSTNEQPMGYSRALLRVIFSLGGMGTLLVLLDFKYKQSLQDRLANTEMLVLTKDANHHGTWK